MTLLYINPGEAKRFLSTYRLRHLMFHEDRLMLLNQVMDDSKVSAYRGSVICRTTRRRSAASILRWKSPCERSLACFSWNSFVKTSSPGRWRRRTWYIRNWHSMVVCSHHHRPNDLGNTRANHCATKEPERATAQRERTDDLLRRSGNGNIQMDQSHTDRAERGEQAHALPLYRAGHLLLPVR